ncbi:DUF4177 domain-containing protein [Cognatishimia sp.]|uniref:DUF4177 domain-containing protein n=1 Tax=Cognatishimia sp. TaxID=2211648 RepID=UPI00351880C8
MVYEYKVIPAPAKGRKARGLRKPEDKFALAIQEAMNEMALLGWEFVRSETLPNTERTGLTRHTTTDRSLLVFRREVEQAVQTPEAPAPTETPAPVPAVVPEPVVAPAEPPAVAASTPVEPQEPTVVPLPKPAPKVAEKAPEPREQAEAPRAKAMDESSFPDPRAPEPPKQKPQALFTPDSIKSTKSSKANALPAALRSRASQAQDGKKA